MPNSLHARVIYALCSILSSSALAGPFIGSRTGFPMLTGAHAGFVTDSGFGVRATFESLSLIPYGTFILALDAYYRLPLAKDLYVYAGGGVGIGNNGAIGGFLLRTLVGIELQFPNLALFFEGVPFVYGISPTGSDYGLGNVNLGFSVHF